MKPTTGIRDEKEKHRQSGIRQETPDLTELLYRLCLDEENSRSVFTRLCSTPSKLKFIQHVNFAA
jgi:hypothetical protein